MKTLRLGLRSLSQVRVGVPCSSHNNSHGQQHLSTSTACHRYDKDTIRQIITWNTENQHLFGPLLKKKQAPGGNNTGEDEANTQQLASIAEEKRVESKKNSQKNTKKVLVQEKPTNIATAPISPLPESLSAATTPYNFVDEPPSSDLTTEPEDVQLNQPDLSMLDPVMTFPFFSVRSINEFIRTPPELPEINIPGYTERAAYENPYFPSVGTILSTTQPPESRIALARWRKKMIAELGEEGFRLHHKATLSRGINFHTTVEEFLNGEPEDKLVIDPDNEGYWESSRSVRNDISDVVNVEHTVLHRQLCYKGIYDCVARYRGELCLIEWKTSKASKADIRWTYDNPLQVAGYLGAFNFDPPQDLQVDKGLIVISYADGQPAHAHLMSRAMCVDYWGKWLHRLHQYWVLKLQDKVPPFSPFG